ncbi:hypothetical protein PENSPDRAFT_647324 [Peniophora sp. CONT]|nr:hypothetical protein PENSPDRAFT_647324 [Peniophora sp. CONT]
MNEQCRLYEPETTAPLTEPVRTLNNPVPPYWVPPPPPRRGASAVQHTYGVLQETQSGYSLVLPSPRTNSPVSITAHDTTADDEPAVFGRGSPPIPAASSSQAESILPYQGPMRSDLNTDNRPYGQDPPYETHEPREPYQLNGYEEPVIPPPRSSSPMAGVNWDNPNGGSLPELHQVVVDPLLDEETASHAAESPRSRVANASRLEDAEDEDAGVASRGNSEE